MAEENISLSDLEFQFQYIGELSFWGLETKICWRLSWIYDKVRNKANSILFYFLIGTGSEYRSVFCGRFSKWDSGCTMSHFSYPLCSKNIEILKFRTSWKTNMHCEKQCLVWGLFCDVLFCGDVLFFFPSFWTHEINPLKK